MKRVAMLFLAGATTVAAQTSTPAQTKAHEMEPTAVQLHEKLQIALNNAGENAERARKAAIEFQKQMKGKSAEERQKAIDQYRAQIQERLHNAITALEGASIKVGAQIYQLQERIQSRLQERKDELVDLQERIRSR